MSVCLTRMPTISGEARSGNPDSICLQIMTCPLPGVRFRAKQTGGGRPGSYRVASLCRWRLNRDDLTQPQPPGGPCPWKAQGCGVTGAKWERGLTGSHQGLVTTDPAWHPTACLPAQLRSCGLRLQPSCFTLGRDVNASAASKKERKRP